MFEFIKAKLNHWLRAIVLRGYGWQPRKTIYLGNPTLQWCNPFTSVWVTEKVAVKLLKDQLMDEYRHR